VPALIVAALVSIVGALLVIFHRPFSRRVRSERERLGVHIGTESHPTTFLLVGLIFVVIALVILVGTFTNAFSGSPRA
jgi:hypothetical protein